MNHPARLGFTLLELIISVAVLGTVMTIVTQSLDSGARLNDRVTRQTDINNRANDVVNKLSMQLRQASAGSTATMSLELPGGYPTGYTPANPANYLNVKSYKFLAIVGVTSSPDLKTWTEQYEASKRVIIYDYSVDPGRLLIQVPDAAGVLRSPELLSDEVSANGFSLVRVGNTLQMSLNLRSKTRVNEDIVYTAQAQTLFLRSTLNASSGSSPVTYVDNPEDADGVAAGTTTSAPSVMFGNLVTEVTKTPPQQQMTLFITAPIGQKVDPRTIVLQLGDAANLSPETVAEGATVSVGGATVTRTTYPGVASWPSRNGTYSITLTGTIPSTVTVTATAATQAGVSVTEVKRYN
jgi:prepilin-type N-terminal cleavage/methylation domain-containing protein